MTSVRVSQYSARVSNLDLIDEKPGAKVFGAEEDLEEKTGSVAMFPVHPQIAKFIQRYGFDYAERIQRSN